MFDWFDVFFIALCFVFIYGIIDRICKCVENKNMCKAYNKFIEMTGATDGQSKNV